MAQVPYEGGVPTVAPRTDVPDVTQRIRTDPGQFGGDIARGLQQAGAGLTKASEQMFDTAAFYGRVNVDDQVNGFMKTMDATLYGDPSKATVGPDGQAQPDLGYMGLQGRSAADAREATLKALEEARTAGRNNLKSDREKLDYDTQTRRMYTLAVQRMGTHAERGWMTWAGTVNKTTEDQSIAAIYRDPDDADNVANAASDLIRARVKQAELRGGGPELLLEAQRSAKADALAAQVASIGVTNPARALGILEKNREVAGQQYPKLYSQLRSRADQQLGRGIADEALGRRGQVSAEQVHGAIIQQESGGNPNVRNSTDGAVGIGQIMPDTFRQYARPGERIDNPRDNLAVSQRIINDYYQKYDGDAARVAVAYFSGPGNVAPPGSATPWKVDKADQQGKGKRTSEYVSDILNRVGGVSGPLPDKAVAFERIVERTRDNPGLQTAALSWANHVYSAYNTGRARESAEFKTRVQDTSTEAMRTGTVAEPITRTEFEQNYGAEAGAQAFEAYQAHLQLAADLTNVATMSPDEQAALLQHYEPRSGEGYADQTKRYGILEDAIKRVRKEAMGDGTTKGDPGAFAMNRLPAVRQAWAGMSEALGNPQAPDAAKKAAVQNFVNVTLAEQERVGIPPQQRNVLPKATADEIANNIMKPGAEGGPANVAANIEREKNLWGKAWPLIYKQIQADALPIVRVIGSDVTPFAGRRLTEIAPLKFADIMKNEETEKASQVKKDVLEAFAPFKATLVGSEDRMALFDDFRGQGEKLAASLVVDGMSSREAAERAFKELLGHKYNFVGGNMELRDVSGGTAIIPSGYRVPKNVPESLAEIEWGARVIQRGLKEDDFRPPRDTFGGLRPEYLSTIKPGSYARDGVWVTAGGDNADEGLWLVYNDEVVRRKDGTPLFMTWKQLAQAGRGADLPGTAFVRPGVTAP